MTGVNLSDQAETLLPAEPALTQALSRSATQETATVVGADPKSLMAWSVLADYAHSQGHLLEAYAYSRVGDRRCLDVLRQAGWRSRS